MIRPILFNTEMVQAILDNRKTATRRVLRHPFEIHPNGWITRPKGNERLCPYEPPYQPGDILYVRETWTNDKLIFGDGVVSAYRYKTDGEEFLNANGEYIDVLWHPSIHMPKEAARIFLKVTDIRVERLQEMTASESSKEGIRLPKEYDTKERAYILGFADLWDSTIKKSDFDLYGWDANPWVWVIEFERCEKPEGWCV